MRAILASGLLLVTFSTACKQNSDTDDTGDDYERGCIVLDGGGAYRWLSDALRDASDGSTIIVCETIEESVLVDKQVTIVGNGVSNTIWSPPSNEPAVTVTEDGDLTLGYLMIESSRNAITVEAGGALEMSIVLIEGVGSYGIEATEATVLLDDVQIRLSEWGAIRMDGGTLSLSDSVIDFNTAYGVLLEAGAVATLSNNTFTNTLYSGDGSTGDGWGVSAQSGSEVALEGDRFKGNVIGGIESLASTVEATDVALDESLIALWFENSTVDLTRCEVTNTARYDIISDNTELILVDTLLTANPETSPYEDTTDSLMGGYGIIASYGSITMTGGEISGHNGAGFYIYGSPTEYLVFTLTDAVITNNGGQGGMAQMADLQFTNVELSHTRNHDELCVADYSYSCNWALAAFEADVTWNGGSIIGNDDLGLVSQLASVELTNITVADNELYGLWLIYSSLQMGDSVVQDTGLMAINLQESVGILDNVDFEDRSHVEYSDWDPSEYYWYYEAVDIYVSDGTLVVQNSSFTNGEEAIMAISSDVTVEDTTFSGYNQYGVYLSGGTATIDRSSFDDFGGRAIYCTSSASVEIATTQFRDTTEILSKYDYWSNGVFQYTSSSNYGAPVIYAAGCSLGLQDVHIENASDQAVFVDDGQVDFEGLTVLNTGTDTAFDDPAIDIEFDTMTPDVWLNEVEITGVLDGAALSVHDPTPDLAGTTELRGLSIGLDDGAGHSGIASEGIFLSGVHNAMLVGFDIANTDDQGIDVINSSVTITGVNALDPEWDGTITKTGAQGVRGRQSDLVLTDVVIDQAGASGVYLYGGNHTVQRVTVNGAPDYGMECNLDAGLEPTFDVCDDNTITGTLDDYLGCWTCTP